MVAWWRRGGGGGSRGARCFFLSRFFVGSVGFDTDDTKKRTWKEHWKCLHGLYFTVEMSARSVVYARDV